jgi:hypothetical protein
MTKKKPDSLERMSENGYPTIDEVQSRSVNVDFIKYRDGDFDHNLGHRIEALICKSENSIVYLDENGYAQWAWKNESPNEDIDHVLDRACEVEQMPNELLSQSQLATAHRYVGEAIARAFTGHSNEANKMLEKAESWIRMRNEELGRIWQLTGSGITVAIAILAGVLLLIFGSQVKQMLNVTTLDILLGGVSGCIGAFLSLASRTGTLKLDPSAGRTLHTIEGGVRVIAGGVGAVFVAFAIKANLLLGAINSTSVQFPLLISFCMAAGFSERFVPSFVRTLESKALENENLES